MNRVSCRRGRCVTGMARRAKAAYRPWIPFVVAALAVIASDFGPSTTHGATPGDPSLASRVPAADAESPDARLELAGQLGGSVYGVALDDGVAWMGVGPRVVTFDVADPAAPARIGGTAMLPDIVRDIAIVDDHVFVLMSGLSGENGSISHLWVFDAGTPAAPRVIGKVSADTSWTSLSVAGGVACATDADAVSVIDVADPAHPAVAGAIASEAELCRLLPGRRMIGAGEEQVELFDVSTPGAPRRLDAVPMSSWVMDTAVVGDTLLAVVDEDGGVVQAFAWHGDRLARVSDDVGISDVGAIGTDGARMTVLDYAAGGIRLFDVADPTAPEEIGSIDVPALAPDAAYATYAPAIAVAGDTVALAGAYSGLYTLDIADPADPAVAATFVGPSYANDVAIHDGIAYVSTSVGPLWAIDVADPEQPVVLGHAFPEVVDGVIPDLGALAWADDLLFALDFATDVGTLRIFDVSDPRAPVEAGAVDLGHPPYQTYDIAVEDGLAYVPHGGHVSIVDVRDPARARVLSTRPYHAKSVAVLGNHLYVAVENRSLVVLDVTDPSQPAEVGVIETNIGQVTRAGTHLFASVDDRPVSLRVYDLSDPARPQPLAELADFNAAVGSIAVAGAFAVRDLGYGFDLVYTGDLPNLTSTNVVSGLPMGTLTMFSAANSVAATGRHALAAQGEAGLFVLRRADAPDQPIELAPPYEIFLPALGIGLASGDRTGGAPAGCATTRVVLALDASRDRGGGSGPPGLSDADYAAALADAARTFVRAVGVERVSIGLLRYHRQAELIATGDDPAALDAALDGLALGAGRRIDVALAAAARTVRPPGAAQATGDRPLVVLVAAGPVDDGTAGRAFAEAHQLRAGGIGVATVAFGTAADHELLAALADSPEHARAAAAPEDLAPELEAVGRDATSGCTGAAAP